ncbi:beta-lactamase/transpeptidase-like protein [Globomyces pollinis-pini]|nr:beta-lactamase/transpeptidase-like protein [Globomyces pollinis-pini]KAJ2994682.1 hypothetical protein HDV02_001378 [Globomyces sp. JEL0801]
MIFKSDSQFLSKFQDYLHSELERLSLPGLTIAIIKENEIIFNKAFGVKVLDSDNPNNDFTSDTLIEQCSITKSVAAAAISILVNQEKLEWNCPIISYMDLELADPYINENITVLDLLSHRSGLACHDAIWNGTNCLLKSTETYLQNLKHLDFTDSFRDSMVYGNITYGIIGLLISKITGLSFYDFVQENIFVHLNIQAESYLTLMKKEITDVVSPHTVDYTPEEFLEQFKSPGVSPNLKVKTLKHFVEGNEILLPAGGFYMSTNDMIKWIQCLMNDGRNINGKQVIYDMNVLTNIHNANGSEKNGPFSYRGYGGGLEITQFDKHHIVNHGGGMAGISTALMCTIDSTLGVYVGLNCDYASNLTYDLSRFVFASLIDSSESEKVISQVETDIKSLPFTFIKEHYEELLKYKTGRVVKNPKFEKFIGTYFNPAYGKIEISSHTLEYHLYMQREPDIPITMYPMLVNEIDSDDSGLMFYTMSGINVDYEWSFGERVGEIFYLSLYESSEVEVIFEKSF